MKVCEKLSDLYDWSVSRFSKIEHPLIVILIIGLALRILFLPLTNVDSWGWYRTGENIISGDGFYERFGFVYAPGFGYLISLTVILGNLLFDIGTFAGQSDAMIALQSYFTFRTAIPTPWFLASFKIMAIVGDVLCAFTVRWIIRKYTNDTKSADISFALVFLSPIIVVESGIHGMFDIYCGLLSLLAVYFVSGKRYFLTGFTWSMATFMKLFPIFLMPVLIAFILKQNKDSMKNAMLGLGYAVAGCLASFALQYYPQALNGTLDKTMYTMTSRLDQVLNYLSILIDRPVLTIVGLALFIILVYLIHRYHPNMNAVRGLSAKTSIAIVALIILGIFGGLIIINGGITEMFSNLFATSYLVGVTMQGFALLVSFILAYLLYKSNMEDQTRLVMIAGTLSIATSFLWVPMPEYLIMILPLIAVYSMVYDKRYLIPFVLISVGSAFFIIMVEGPAALFVSLGEHTSLIDIETVISLTKAYVSGITLGEYSIWQLLFCAIGAAVQFIGTALLFVYRFKPYRKEEEFI